MLISNMKPSRSRARNRSQASIGKSANTNLGVLVGIEVTLHKLPLNHMIYLQLLARSQAMDKWTSHKQPLKHM